MGDTTVRATGVVAMVYRFDEFEIDTQNYQLRRNGTTVKVEPKVFDLLSYLVANRDKLVSRDELFENIWSGQVVSDTSLSNQIKEARRAIGDNGQLQSSIKTIHGRGYQFIAATEAIETHGREGQARMEDCLPCKLAAILYADIVGYSRLTGADEGATHRTLSEYLDIISSIIDSNRGRVMHHAGDAVLAKFDAVVDAMSAAVAIQNELKSRNKGVASERQVQFRIGVNIGDVIEDRGDIYGDGVNVAARLEALAQPGGICISDAVRTAAGNELSFQYQFIGEQRVKNTEEPVRAYHIFEAGVSLITPPHQATKNVSSILRPPGKPSLVIKPFENVSADPGQDYFADGLTQDITIALIKIPGLFLTLDETPSYRKSRKMTVHELGREFGVRYVLKGGVRKSGDRVRVNAELIESSTGEYLWGERFDREIRDLFVIQDEITEEIVTAMDVKLLAGDTARFHRKALKNPAALDSSYRGWDLLYNGKTKRDIQESQQKFEEVIRLEPMSSLGYAAASSIFKVSSFSWNMRFPQSSHIISGTKTIRIESI